MTNYNLPPDLPGIELLSRGLADIDSGLVSEYALLVQIASPRLLRLSFEIPGLTAFKGRSNEPAEHQLYDLVNKSGGFSYFNSLLRRMASLLSAMEHEVERTKKGK